MGDTRGAGGGAEQRGAEIRRDLDATVEARRELGPEYEAELVESFVDRLDATIQQRVDERLAQAPSRVPRPADDEGDAGNGQQFVLALASLGMSIPITAIATSNGGLLETAVAWFGIVGVNAAFAWSRRR